MLIENKPAEALYPPPPPYEAIAQTWSSGAGGTAVVPSSPLPPPPPRSSSPAPTSTFSDYAPTAATAGSELLPDITLSFDSSPYLNSTEVQMRASTPRRTRALRLSDLPSAIVLQVVYDTFPKAEVMYGAENKAQLQRETLFWLETSLRLVNKVFYSACMHILRITYLPAYRSMVRHPYTCDPLHVSPARLNSPVGVNEHRELLALDHFIVLLAYEDVMLDHSTLVMPREEAYTDLFLLLQPKSRLEDLVRHEGVNLGVVLADSTRTTETATESSAELSYPRDTKSGGSSSMLTYSGTESTIITSDGTVLLQPPPLLGSEIIHARPSAHTGASPSSPSKSQFSSFMSSAKAKAKQRLQRSKPPSPSLDHQISAYPYPHPNSRKKVTPLPFASLSINFTTRTVGLMYTAPQGQHGLGGLNAAFNGSAFGSLSLSAVSHSRHNARTLCEVSRARDERLEETARKLVYLLRDVLEES